MGIISKSIFEDILSLVLENRFRDRVTDPQNDALFEILNREDVFAILTDWPWKIHHIPVSSRSLPSVGARICYVYSCILIFVFGVKFRVIGFLCSVAFVYKFGTRVIYFSLPPFSLETFPKFPSILRVIDRSDRNPPIPATSVTFWPSLLHASGPWLVDFDPICR